MSLPIVFRPEAEQDVASARDWYSRQRPGLDDDLLAQLTDFLDQVSAMPGLHAIVWQDVRACKLSRFPYVVYYRALADRVEVLAVLHGSRDASAWKSRT